MNDFAFGRKPSPEVLNYLKEKGWKPAFSYKDVWGDEHAFAFTVAKALKMDILVAIREALEQAIKEGIPFEQFQKELKPVLVDAGWWGEQEMEDPETGETDLVQLGSPRRLKIIYRANIGTARSQAQYLRAQRTKKALPYFIYELGPSREHRLEHSNVAGTILPVDDPFWDTWMPKNGWGCKCRVRQIGAAELRRKGLKVSDRPTIETVKWVNDRTGEIHHVPKGIDPGWDNNPGKARHDILEKKLEESGLDFEKSFPGKKRP